jgi:hypothetical protein
MDISPSNLMLGGAGAIVMLDFSRPGNDGGEFPSYHPGREVATERKAVFATAEDNQKLKKVVGMLNLVTIKIYCLLK